MVGFALAAYPVGVERGFWSRAEAVERTLTTLRFFWNGPHGTEPDASGYRGFYYNFENSRRAAYVQQEYAARSPRGFEGYGRLAWGVTASDGRGPESRRINGVDRSFLGYRARGVPYGPDDGTLAPWGILASLPFAPEIALPAIRHCLDVYPETRTSYGFIGSFNPTYPSSSGRASGWVCQVHYALNQGTQRLDDRESPFGPGLAADAGLPLRRHRLAPGRVCERLAVMPTGSLTATLPRAVTAPAQPGPAARGH